MENDKEDQRQNADILQHMSQAHFQHQVAGKDIKHQLVAESKPGIYQHTDPEEKVEMDRSYLEEADIKHHKTVSYMESTGETQKRKTKEQLEERPGGRTERQRDELGGGGEDSPEQSEMEVCRGWPMLLRERRA